MTALASKKIYLYWNRNIIELVGFIYIWAIIVTYSIMFCLTSSILHHSQNISSKLILIIAFHFNTSSLYKAKIFQFIEEIFLFGLLLSEPIFLPFWKWIIYKHESDKTKICLFIVIECCLYRVYSLNQLM